jgi:hypothetical protein
MFLKLYAHKLQPHKPHYHNWKLSASFRGECHCNLDLMTSKLLRVLYQSWPIYQTSLMTVGQSILSLYRQHFSWTKCLWSPLPWPLTYCPCHLQVLTNLPIKFNNQWQRVFLFNDLLSSKLIVVIDRSWPTAPQNMKALSFSFSLVIIWS